ncbi:MAG: peptidoglycan-binding protein [Candidatus Omnitrophica bacterium]|nr:peptidoglycan-binding protein [Candidatus Omnitrophota bacterium]
MFVLRAGLFVTMLALLAGCATGGSQKEFVRLQSQVGILDERVTQLERSRDGGVLAAMPMESVIPVSAAAAVPEMAAPAKASSAASASTAASTIKPTTREIQQALKNAGFYQGPIDGKLGPQTREAVKEFQRVHGLKDDGVVGKQTWSKLNAYATLSAKSGELDAAEVLK